MRKASAAHLAELTHARLVGDGSALIGPDVVIDSRAVTQGCLFVALPGEHADGHDFAGTAVDAGAGALLVGHELPLPVPQLVVEDPTLGLAELAKGLVREADATTIGITGSVGKTSAKDLLAQVLAATAPTVAPVGSFNNEIGVPLTAARVDEHTRFLISEMGARGLGHISWLCGIVPPQVGLVLNVGHAHLGEFGSVAAIAQAKGELIEALPETGWAVLNADDAAVAAMTGRTRARVAAFSRDGEPGFGELRVWATEVSAGELQQARFQLHAAGTLAGTVAVKLAVSGVHHVANALAAATAALTQGLSLELIGQALGTAVARSRWRMELATRDDGLLVINDAYNANPESMAAALQALSSMRRPGGRLLAVLGDMLELGEGAATEHRAIGALAGQLGVNALIVLGANAADLATGAAPFGITARIADSREHAAVLADTWLQPDDVVLVKASRGLALEKVAELLLSGEGNEG